MAILCVKTWKIIQVLKVVLVQYSVWDHARSGEHVRRGARKTTLEREVIKPGMESGIVDLMKGTRN